MFRGKESSNRIELSRLVQDLLNFGVLGSLRLWGWGGWVDGGEGWLGGAPHTCAHARTRTHACTHTHAYACVVNMIIPCKWLPPLDLGKSQGFPMMSYVRVHACVCMRACACVHVRACTCVCTCVGGPCHHPPPHPPTPPPRRVGGPPESVKIQ